MKLKLSLVIGLGLATLTDAATRNAVTPSYNDVNNAVNGVGTMSGGGTNYTTPASDGDTIIIPAGTATWSASVSTSSAITIQGAGATSTILSVTPGTVSGSDTLYLFGLNDGSSNNLPRRVTGIGFKGPVINGQSFGNKGTAVRCFGYLSKKRVDHCRFDDMAVSVWAVNSIGVTDHNSTYHGGIPFRHSGTGSNQQYAWDNFRVDLGGGLVGIPFDSLNYMFHEDEYIEMSGDSIIADEVESTSYVFRHCTIKFNKATGPYTRANGQMFDCHGDQAPPAFQYSALTTQIYENNITVEGISEPGCGNSPNPACVSASVGHLLDFRGGLGQVFNNTIVTTGDAQSGGGAGAKVSVWDENWDYECPCPPGDGRWTHWSNPIYRTGANARVFVWNNTYKGVVNGPQNDNHGGSQVIILNSLGGNSDPAKSYAWTIQPATIITPTYPHPLVTGAPTPTPTPAGFPVITTQPVSITITSGQTPTFSVTIASGSGNVSYQWKKNGANLVRHPTSGTTGATTDALVSPDSPPATLADNGAAYACVVTATAGSLTSNDAILTVLPAPFALPTWHAVDGTISSPFVINGDNTISQTSQATGIDATSGQATYPFTVPNPANATGYTLSELVDCPDDASNSVFLSIDSQPTTLQAWFIPVTSGLEERDVIISPETAPHVWMLTPGTHQLIMRGREANAKFKEITFHLVSNPSPTPTPTPTPTAVLPSFAPNGGAGPFTTSVAVTLSTTTPGGTMQYTIDGTDSRFATALLPYTTPIPVDHSLTIKAFTSASGYLDSPQATSQPYVVVVATPGLTSSTGSFTATGMLSVTVTDSTPSAVLYYSTDGSTPSIPYGVPVVVNSTCIFKAIAKKTNCTDSAIASQAIVINSPSPTPTPTATASATATPTVTPLPVNGIQYILP